MPSPSLAETLYDKILELLLDGSLQPGTLINRREFASEYQVSVTPVTEAFTRLEYDGFLETLPRKGTQVRLVTKESVVDNFILRDAVEAKAARMYYGEPIRSSLPSLLDFARQVNDAPDDHLQDWKTEINFHHRLVELANCRPLIETYERTMHLSMFYGMNQYIPENLKSSRDDHIALVRNLAAAESAENAESIIRKHVWYGKQYLIEGKRL